MSATVFKFTFIALIVAIGIGIAVFNPGVYPLFTNIPPGTSMKEESEHIQKEQDAMKNVDMIDAQGTHQITSEDVSYFGDAQGLYAAPAEEGSYPGVVMIHEWWGLNDNIKETARQLASEGYRVLAVDLYHGEVATEAGKARELTGALNQDEALQNLQEAVRYLRERGSTKIASLGWCFGGGQSLQLSLSGTLLDATVIYYGSLVTDPKELARISWPVLGIFGETDQSIPPTQVNEFEQALEQNNIENSITIYPGVGHAFANPSGQNYAPEPTMDAWKKTLAFLQANLK